MTSDALIAAVGPNAAALVVAVEERDQAEVAAALSGLDIEHLHALVILLAASVSPDVPLAMHGVDLTPEKQVARAVELAARAFGTTVEAIYSTDRHRNVLDGRMVAMAALRYVGLTSVYVGQALSRDHSTVLHAAGRVGEVARLRKAAVRIADDIGIRGDLGDELEGEELEEVA